MKSIMPILIPIILIFFNTTLVTLSDTGVISVNETFLSYVTFFGDPVIAVGIGLIVSIYTLARHVTRLDALRSEEHTSELQSRGHLVCRLLLENKNETNTAT